MATRRRSPPDSTSTGVSPGGHWRASIACSSWDSRSHALRWSSSSWRVPISAIRESKSASGSAISMPIALKRSTLASVSATASCTFSMTVLSSVSGGSCSRMPTVLPLPSIASPLLGFSRPAMILSRVDLPAPLGPTTPILAPS